MIFNREGKELI